MAVFPTSPPAYQLYSFTHPVPYNRRMASATAALCVYCREKPVEPAWRPFCSERCRLLDLARWIDGDYRVAGESAGSADDTDESNDLGDVTPDASRPHRTSRKR
jgi:uncharacterized protein